MQEKLYLENLSYISSNSGFLELRRAIIALVTIASSPSVSYRASGLIPSRRVKTKAPDSKDSSAVINIQYLSIGIQYFLTSY